MDYLVTYLTATFPFAPEWLAFGMSLQGVMAVRNGRNKDGSMNWFHAFCVGVVAAFGGALFTPFFMGKPTSMLSTDLNLTMCIFTYVLINHTPGDIGYKIFNTVPGTIVAIAMGQMFRCMGIIKFVNVAHTAFKANPSPFYPVPIFGPIVYATLLGNMGPFFLQGFDGHLKNGMPWAFQNGLFCASFYHFYVNDLTGPIGNTLRAAFPPIPGFEWGWEDRIFATVFVSAFMQVTGLCHMPQVLGPKFSPFSAMIGYVDSAMKRQPPAPAPAPATTEEKKEEAPKKETKQD